jgi:uncharacterized protein (TIGR00730 family)
MTKRVCVYCSSSNILEDKYIEAARVFAEAASLLGYCIVCGGSSMGLMGVIIDTMLKNQARVEGAIPEFMGDMEIQHPEIKNLTIVDTMSKRKDFLRENTDAVIAFPGGLGTLEELLETYTLKRLGKYDGAVIIFNQDGYYNKLLELLEHFVEKRFLKPNYRESLIVVNSVEELMNTIKISGREILRPEHY